jgi:hypothetical protein
MLDDIRCDVGSGWPALADFAGQCHTERPMPHRAANANAVDPCPMSLCYSINTWQYTATWRACQALGEEFAIVLIGSRRAEALSSDIRGCRGETSQLSLIGRPAWSSIRNIASS